MAFLGVIVGNCTGTLSFSFLGDDSRIQIHTYESFFGVSNRILSYSSHMPSI